MMKKLFTPLLLLTAIGFVFAPVLIYRAPYESSMGLVQKIFYFHVPSWIAMFSGGYRLRRCERGVSLQGLEEGRPTRGVGGGDHVDLRLDWPD